MANLNICANCSKTIIGGHVQRYCPPDFNLRAFCGKYCIDTYIESWRAKIHCDLCKKSLIGAERKRFCDLKTSACLDCFNEFRLWAADRLIQQSVEQLKKYKGIT